MKNFLYLIFTMVLMLIATTTLNAAGDPEKSKKDNVILYPVKDDPTISFRVWFKVGAQDDPKGKEGLAYLVSSFLSEGGTTKYSYDKILEELFPLAAGYSASTTMEMTIFSGRVHKDNLSRYLELYIDQLLNPVFNEEDFKRIKDNALNYFKTTLRYSNDEELGKAVLYNDIFEGTNYGHVVTGNISGLNSITLDDIKAFYKKYFNRNNFILGMGGGYDNSLVQSMQEKLSNLPDGIENISTAPQPKKINGFEITIVEKKAKATAISMGFPINLLRGEKDWYALSIANSWLGEHRNSSSHLYQVIRELRGLNYGDYSYIENYPNGSRYSLPPLNVPRKKQIFEIWIRPVPNEARIFSFRAALREFENIATNGMKSEDFELTKKFLKSYVLHYAPNTNGKLAYAIDDKFYGMNESHLKKFRTMMDEITLDDVNKAIKKYWQIENMKVVFVTDAAEKLQEDLISNAPSPITYSTPKDKSILEEDRVIRNFSLKIGSDRVKIIKVEDLFN